jgi:hypothetical protein
VMWPFTVARLTCRRAAISALVSPSATSSATARCRPVEPVQELTVTQESRTVSPHATARTPSSRRCGLAVVCTWPRPRPEGLDEVAAGTGLAQQDDPNPPPGHLPREVPDDRPLRAETHQGDVRPDRAGQRPRLVGVRGLGHDGEVGDPAEDGAQAVSQALVVVADQHPDRPAVIGYRETGEAVVQSAAHPRQLRSGPTPGGRCRSGTRPEARWCPGRPPHRPARRLTLRGEFIPG